MFAQACGATGFTLDDPAQCASTMEQFLNTPGPAILDALVDPNEPPLPAKIKPEQALHFAESLARGEKDALEIAKTVFKDRVREMV
jgi:pyruvate dehydrogenase (quinone)